MKEYKYTHPDFTQKKFTDAPECRFEKAPCDGVAPQNFHAMSIYPEYFKVGGEWLLAGESRMDCVPVLRNGRIEVVEFRNLMKNDMVAVGRTEDCEDGMFRGYTPEYAPVLMDGGRSGELVDVRLEAWSGGAFRGTCIRA